MCHVFYFNAIVLSLSLFLFFVLRLFRLRPVMGSRIAILFTRTHARYPSGTEIVLRSHFPSLDKRYEFENRFPSASSHPTHIQFCFSSLECKLATLRYVSVSSTDGFRNLNIYFKFVKFNIVSAKLLKFSFVQKKIEKEKIISGLQLINGSLSE